MYAMPGVGLAAPQLGIGLRLAVVDCSPSKDQPIRLANPRIVWASDEMRSYEEASPNLPGASAAIERPAEVRVGWIDENGNPQEKDFDGLWATCVQHEIDHLDGKLFIDYLKPLKRQMITRKMVKLKKERARA